MQNEFLMLCPFSLFFNLEEICVLSSVSQIWDLLFICISLINTANPQYISEHTDNLGYDSLLET